MIRDRKVFQDVVQSKVTGKGGLNGQMQIERGKNAVGFGRIVDILTAADAYAF